MRFVPGAEVRRIILAAAIVVPSTTHCLAQQVPSTDAATSDTSENRIQAVQGEIIELQRQLLELRGQTQDESVLRRAKKLEAELADRLRFLEWWQSSSESGEGGAVDALKEQLVARDDALVEMKIRLQAAYEQLEESDRARELPKLENATIKVFSLKSLKASAAADTITAILGEREVRVAPDQRSNALVVAADEESTKLIEALLLKLDDAAAAEAGLQPAVEAEAPSQSLLLRTFWLADGLPEGEGEDASQYLPGSVLKTMKGLGLNEPRLVCQTVNALSRDESADRLATFDTSVPALLFEQQAQLKCKGAIRALREGRAEVEATIEVQSPTLSTQLSGSLAMPLGHYMVLGTANSVSFDPTMMSGAGMMPGMGGMDMGMEGGGDAFADAAARGGGRGDYGGGMEGGSGAPADPAAANPEPQYNTSHFAFVVQINEAESFAEEK